MALPHRCLLLTIFSCLFASCVALSESEIIQRVRTAPKLNLERSVIDGSGTEMGFEKLGGSVQGFGETEVGSARVSVSTVAWLTLAMAAASGIGAVPFFFVELEPQWAGVCNGLAAGVMLAASFDLVQEGQTYGSGNWVVVGILAGGIFIWLCKKFLEHYGEVSMLDIKGADASKVILVVGIMTLHSFGEGSGVGVSFAGPKGLSQGLLVTLAIAIHNIPEGLAVSMLLSSRGVSPQNAMLWSIITSLPQAIVAVPSFLCAGTFQKILPLCTGFAAGCMVWIVIAEVLPDAFKEANSSQVASAGTLAVAFMETLSVVFQGVIENSSNGNTSGFFVSLLFGLGPLFGGLLVVTAYLAFHLPHSLLNGLASGIAFLLSAWRPLQLLVSLKMGPLMLLLLLGGGSVFYYVLTFSILSLPRHNKASVNDLPYSPGPSSFSIFTLQSFFACGAISLHALAEGLALGVAAPKAYGFGQHMVLPVSLHGLPRGAAVASCIFGATDSWRGALAAAAVTGLAGPISAIGAILAGIGYDGLDYWMVFACGALLSSFGTIFQRSMKLETKKSIFGLLLGLGFACLCLTSTRLVCLYTPYCNSAPEAVT